MLRSIGAVIAMLSAFGAVGAESPPAAAAANPATSPMTPANPVRGYLAPGTAPSSGTLVPPAPSPGSGTVARDEDVSRSALAMHGTPRWELAAQDAVLAMPAVAQSFSCALNAPISEEKTPQLIRLLRRTLIDSGRSTSEAKKKYQRARPFMVNGKPLCTPNGEQALRADGSYPSGHAAIGYAFGLVLSEISPEQANALLARGRAFGQSRIVCNVHWQSDVIEGQLMAAAVVARLHAEPEFRQDVEAARAEVAALRAQSATPARDCAVESQTLQSWQ